MKGLQKRRIMMVALFSLIFTAMQVAGYRISMIYQTTVHQSEFLQHIGVLSAAQTVLWAVIEFMIGCVIIYAVYTWLEKLPQRKGEYSGTKVRLLMFATAALLFVCWIPCFRAVYPGFYNYDAMSQVPQVVNHEGQYSAHHPLVHTLLMGNIMDFGYHQGTDLNDGIALYSVFQMSVCAIAFAYMVFYILKLTGRRWLAALAFGYYAFSPPIIMFVLCTTKDILFSVLLQFCVIYLYEMCVNMQGFFGDRKKILRFVVVTLLMCLMRKNGIYALLCVVPFVWIWAKRYRRQIALLFGSVLAIYVMISKGLVWVLDAEEASSEEMLSVPMQQIARVYRDHGEEAFREEELEIIYEGISCYELANYNPFLSDYIKNYFDYNVILDNKVDYVKLWINKGVQYPRAYIMAFLDNTYQAWYPGTSIYSHPNDEETYYLDLSMHAGGYRDSRDTELLEFYEKIASQYSYQKIPVVRLLFSIGAMFWVALFVLGYAFWQENIPLIMGMLLVMFCCVTVFLGPISLVRYYLVLFFGFPVSLGYLFMGKPVEKEMFSH